MSATATATNTAKSSEKLNGVNVPVLKKLLNDVKHDRAQGATRWGVTTRWAGGAVSETEVASCQLAGKTINKDFKIRVDEPFELAGTNTAANPQEYLLASLNACMMVGYVALCTLHGIELESVEIESGGNIDLRGFLAIDKTVPAGYEQIEYTVRIKGDGTPEQFEQIHQAVIATSPNRFNLANAIAMKAKLVVE